MGVQTPIEVDGTAARVDRLIAEQRPGYGLTRPFYVEGPIFQRDMERVFRRHWHCVGHASQIPDVGDFMRIDFENEAVVVVRDKDGAINAFLNVCRHRGAEVCTEKEGNAKAFVCPYHAWTYKLDGTLRAARLMPKGFDVSAHSLRRVNLRNSAGLLFISFAEVPLDFEPVDATIEGTCGQYGWGAAKVAHRQTYPVDANWKLAVENYVECYHCGPAHPEYSQTHALQQPQERVAELNAAMEARTEGLGILITAEDRWQDSSHGQEAIHAFRYALYDGISTGSEDGFPHRPADGQVPGLRRRRHLDPRRRLHLPGVLPGPWHDLSLRAEGRTEMRDGADLARAR